MFWSLTADCDVLWCFHCGVVSKRAFVFSSGVTWDICDGVSIRVFHFHQLPLQRHGKQWWVISLWLLIKENQHYTCNRHEWSTSRWDIDEHVYLKVEVKGGRSWVTVCHTLQTHAFSFNKRVRSSYLKDDGLRGVCAENSRWKIREGTYVRVEGVLGKARASQPPTAGIVSVSTLQRPT